MKPILPDKHYLEARISSGDRIVFRVEQGTIYFVDVVKHDVSHVMAVDRNGFAELPDPASAESPA